MSDAWLLVYTLLAAYFIWGNELHPDVCVCVCVCTCVPVQAELKLLDS